MQAPEALGKLGKLGNPGVPSSPPFRTRFCIKNPRKTERDSRIFPCNRSGRKVKLRTRAQQ